MLRLVAITLAFVCLGACGDGFRNYGTDADAGADLGAGQDIPPQLQPDEAEPHRDESQPQCNNSCVISYQFDCDQDGLGNDHEIAIGSDPCEFDTDGDGLSDLYEATFHYDPTKADTYGDGTLDGDRWFVTACEDGVLEPAPTRTVEAEDGSWRLEIGEGWSFERPVEPPGARSGELVGLLEAPNESSLFVSWPSADERIQTLAENSLPDGIETDVRWFEQTSISARSIVFELQFEDPTSPEEARSRVAAMFAPFEPPVGTPSVETSTNYTFAVSLVKQHTDRISMLVGAVPTGRYEEPVAALNEVTSWSMFLRPNRLNCSQKAIALNPERVDLLFVVDNTISLADERAALSAAMEELFARADAPERGIALRVAVEGMDYPDGPVEAQWRTNPDEVVEDLNAIETSTSSGGYGLEVARLASTNHARLSNNRLKVVIIADRGPRSLEEAPSFQLQELRDAYYEYFRLVDLYGVLPAIECGEFTPVPHYPELIPGGRVASSCVFKTGAVTLLDDWIGPGAELPTVVIDFEFSPAILPTVRFWKEDVPLERGTDWYLMHDNVRYEVAPGAVEGDSRGVARFTWVRSQF